MPTTESFNMSGRLIGFMHDTDHIMSYFAFRFVSEKYFIHEYEKWRIGYQGENFLKDQEQRRK